jgi:phytoene dehydrogenase-like protein
VPASSFAADYDAIVVGAGHNGLICAAYLARAGRRTLLVEARDSVGGCASTVNALGNARVNICNCDHRVFRSTPIMEELGLAAHGLRYLDVTPGWLNMAHDDRPAWFLFHDLDRTLEGLRATYPEEVEGYRRYVADALPIARLVIDSANETPTPGALVRNVVKHRGRGVATMLRWSRMAVGDVMKSYFKAEALLAPGIAMGPGVWGLSPRTPGTGLGAITYALEHLGNVGRPVGGSGAVPDAVLAAYLAAGGNVRTSSPVTSIVCEGSATRGVELTDGTVITAPVVVSACDPRVTFVSWLTHAPASAKPLVNKWRDRAVQDGYESKIDGVMSDLPRYRQVDEALATRLGVDPTLPSAIIAAPLDAMHQAWLDNAQGRVASKPNFIVNMPSVLDPSMLVPGPDGGHILSLETIYTPYALQGGWPASREPARWLDVYQTLVQPGWLSGLRRYRAMTPDVYEADFHLPRGHATSFAGGPLGAITGRDPELTRYRTPIAGLYLTGAATFPGAGVWGAAGRNAAHTVLQRD